MLLLFILSFVFPPGNSNQTQQLFCCRIVYCRTVPLAGWPVLESPKAWPDTEGIVLCLTGKLGTGIQLEESFLKGVVMKPTLSGIAWTFWQTVWVTETLFMCLWAPLPAELPFPWQWFPFQVTSAHKVWCNIIENVHAFIRGYSIKYAGTFKYISDCDSKQWLNTCQRFMMKSEVSSFKRQHPFFIGILYCLIYSVYL